MTIEPDGRFAALKAFGWAPRQARKILREAARGDAYAKIDVARALAAGKHPAPANDSISPVAAAIRFTMFGR